jgi:hypothetical protein
MVSLTLCGLLASVHPFFAVTCLSLRLLYPPLFDSASAEEKDLIDLRRLGRMTWAYLLCAAAIPLLAVMALVAVGSRNSLVLGVLSGAGLAGLGLAFWLTRVIHTDLDALAYAVNSSRRRGLESSSELLVGLPNA